MAVPALGWPWCCGGSVWCQWQAPALEGALSSERSLVVCGTAPRRRAPGARRGWCCRGRNRTVLPWSELDGAAGSELDGAAGSELDGAAGSEPGRCCWVGTCGAVWANPGAAVLSGASRMDGSVPVEAARCSGAGRWSSVCVCVCVVDGHTCVRLGPHSVAWSDGQRWGGEHHWALAVPGQRGPGAALAWCRPAPRGARQSVDLPGGVRRTRCSSSPFPSSLCLPRTPVLPAKPLSARS